MSLNVYMSIFNKIFKEMSLLWFLHVSFYKNLLNPCKKKTLIYLVMYKWLWPWMHNFTSVNVEIVGIRCKDYYAQ